MAEIRIEAATEIEFHGPEGSRIWLTTLMPDPECGEQRFQLSVRARAHSEGAARDLMALTLERLRAAVPEERG